MTLLSIILCRLHDLRVSNLYGFYHREILRLEDEIAMRYVLPSPPQATPPLLPSAANDDDDTDLWNTKPASSLLPLLLHERVERGGGMRTSAPTANHFAPIPSSTVNNVVEGSLSPLLFSAPDHDDFVFREYSNEKVTGAAFATTSAGSSSSYIDKKKKNEELVALLPLKLLYIFDEELQHQLVLLKLRLIDRVTSALLDIITTPNGSDEDNIPVAHQHHHAEKRRGGGRENTFDGGYYDEDFEL